MENGHNGAIILPGQKPPRDVLDIMGRNQSIDVLGRVAAELQAGTIAGVAVHILMHEPNGSYNCPVHIATTRNSMLLMAEFLRRSAEALDKRGAPQPDEGVEQQAEISMIDAPPKID